MAVFLAVAAPEVVHGLLGSQWSAAIGPLPIVSIGAFFTAVDVVTTPLFLGLGQPRVEFWKNVVRTAVVTATIVPLTARLGLTGSCLSFLLGSLSPLPVWVYLVRTVNIAGKQLCNRVTHLATLCLAVPCGVWLTRLLGGEPGIATLVIALGMTTALAGLCAALQRSLGRCGIFMHLDRLRLSLRQNRN